MEFSENNSKTSIGQPLLKGTPIKVPTEGYGLITLVGDESLSLKDQSFNVYQDLFNNLNRDNIVRIWNYVPDINTLMNDKTDGYMEFNAGRYTAWEKYGPLKEGKPYCPAATATGARGGPLLVQVLWSENKVRYLKNKRQKRFVEYSTSYGTYPPCSSRLTVEDCGSHWMLWVAGTSAVVGEKTEGTTLSKQCSVTWKNLEALLLNNSDLEDMLIPHFDIRKPSYLRCYLRNEDHLDLYQKEIKKFFDTEPTIHLADICRGSLTGTLYHEVECLYRVEK